MDRPRVKPGVGRALFVLSAVGLLACALIAACGPRAPAGGTRPDWRNATYRITCDDVVPGGFRVRLVNGAARVPADVGETPAYDYFEVRFEADATGDVDGDGKPDTVVLLQCSPQPSNGIVEEAQIFAADGHLLGELPSPRTLPENTVLAPLYDPAGLSIRDGEIVAAMRAYGPDDSHASGPSVPITVRWRWDRHQFLRLP